MPAAAESAELKVVQAHPTACVMVANGQMVAAQADLTHSNLIEVETASEAIVRQLNAPVVAEMA